MGFINGGWLYSQFNLVISYNKKVYTSSQCIVSSTDGVVSSILLYSPTSFYIFTKDRTLLVTIAKQQR